MTISEVAPGPVATAPVPPAFHALTVAAALAAECVDQQQGLAASEVTARRNRFGSNQFREGATVPAGRAFVRQYADLMQIVLLVAGILCLYPLQEYGTGLMLI